MEAPGPPTASKVIKLSRKMKSKNWDALDYPLTAALDIIRYGDQWCEALTESDIVKPYLDYDLGFDHEEADPGVTIDELLNDIAENFNIDARNIEVATREPRWCEKKNTKGEITKRVYKYSFRFFIQNKKVLVKDMGRLMQAGLLQMPGWDKGIYKTNQLLNCIHNRKDPAIDAHCPLLLPVDELTPLEAFVVQVVSDDAQWLPVDDLTDGIEPPAKKGKKSSGGKRDVGRPSTIGFL
eukprot:jgi/Mesvir1/18560/Mv25667-RA.1